MSKRPSPRTNCKENKAGKHLRGATFPKPLPTPPRECLRHATDTLERTCPSVDVDVHLHVNVDLDTSKTPEGRSTTFRVQVFFERDFIFLIFPLLIF